MCSILAANLTAEVDYPQREEHVVEAVKYVSRCGRVKWKRDDLLHVCLFLNEIDETKLLQKYVRQGTRKCPDEPYFHALTGLMEMDKGPWKCNRKLAAKEFQKAIDLGAASDDPLTKEMVDHARRGLLVLEGHGDHRHNDGEPYDADESLDADGFPADLDPAGMSPGDLSNMIQSICEQMGIEPAELLDKMSRGRFKPPSRRRQRKG
jgi:hypothetical protein